MDNWFIQHCKRIIGDGKLTRFWEDVWISEGMKLKYKFPRLYRLSVSPLGTVGDRVQRTSAGFNFIWDWRRPLLDREVTMVSDLESLVHQEPL